jgi:hypothetical protein
MAIRSRALVPGPTTSKGLAARSSGVMT